MTNELKQMYMIKKVPAKVPTLATDIAILINVLIEDGDILNKKTSDRKGSRTVLEICENIQKYTNTFQEK